MTIAQLQHMLKELGFDAGIDADGDLAFHAHGLLLYIAVDRNDPDFVSIFLDMHVWPERCRNELEALRIACTIERSCKCVKCMLLKSGEGFLFRISVEVLNSKEELGSRMVRYIDAVCTSCRRLMNALA